MFHLLLAVIYLSFISLGLPDGLLGSAWPIMYPEMGVPVSYSGILFMIISVGTVVSSLQSDQLTRRFGPGKVTAASTAMTAVALLGFSCTHNFLPLCFWAIPYGLGAGSVDAALNNYVAVHYESKHMSWLHCMWGLGATMGPYIMGGVLTRGLVWNLGYCCVGLIQVVLSVGLVLTLSLWHTKGHSTPEQAAPAPVSATRRLSIPGVKETLVTFFCYCALEQTAALWSASYLVLHRGMDEETAAGFAGLFYIGITVGRFLSGFLTMKLRDEHMIWLGLGLLTFGVLLLILPLASLFALPGLIAVGLGCAPIYPCVIHSTPAHFGEEHSQALVGYQMASAYVGTSLMPPFFGVVVNSVGISFFPLYLFLLLASMAVMHRRVCALTVHTR